MTALTHAMLTARLITSVRALALGSALAATDDPAPRAVLPAPDDRRVAGVYRLDRINGHALPTAERLVGAAGYELVGRVDRVLLNLRASGRFTVDVHYQYSHVVAGTPLPIGREWSDADAGGAWTVRRGQLTLLPDPSRRGHPPPPLTGDWRQSGITMDLRYAGRYTAGRERQYVVRLLRAPNVY